MDVRFARARVKLASLLALALLLTATPLAVAAPGDLDPSFGSSGKVTSDFGGTEELANAVAVDPSGRVIVASTYENEDFAVVRYLPDGSLDASFGGDGRVLTPHPQHLQAYGQGVAVDVAERIVVAGGGYFMAARYNPDGSLDTAFGGDGIALSEGLGWGWGSAMALDSDGKVIVAGYESGPSNRNVAVVRYNTDGTLDTTFGGDGKASADFGADDEGYAVAIDSAGRIVVAGRTGPSGSRDVALARFNTDGSLDTTFDGDGMKVVDFGAGNDEARSVIADAGDRIVIAVSTGVAPNIDFTIARYNFDGAPDTSFSGDGKVVTDFSGGRDVALALTLDGAGRTVAAGSSCATPMPCSFALARYQPDGSLDPSFDGDGKAAAFGLPSSITGGGRAVTLDAGGRIVTTGLVWYSGSGYYAGRPDIGVARFTADGSLDAAFDGDGKVITWFPGAEERAYAVTLDSAGRVVVGGAGCHESGCDFALARYTNNGAPDLTFGRDGSVATELGSEKDDVIRGMAVDGSGRIIVAGYAGDYYDYWSSDLDFAVARYLPDGSLDASFGGQGWVITDFATDRNDYGYAMTLDGSGRIVVAGETCHSGGACSLALARFQADGSLDGSFDGDGKVSIDFPGTNDRAYAVAIDSSSRIVVAGRFGLARFNDNGSLDTTFDNDGVAPTGFTAQSVALDNAGRIVATGYQTVARFNLDGSPDVTFDGDGSASMGFSGQAVAIDRSGRIIVAGIDYAYDFAAARFNSNGSPDTTFGGDGQVTTDFAGAEDGGYALALDSVGRIAVAGYAYAGACDECADDFAVARYLGDDLTSTYLPLIRR